MYAKKIMLVMIVFFSMEKLFSQEVFQMEHVIEVSHFKLVEMACRDMEARGIDLSTYRVHIRIQDNILYAHFFTPEAMNPLLRGSPPGHPILIYEIDIELCKIIRIRGVA